MIQEPCKCCQVGPTKLLERYSCLKKLFSSDFKVVLVLFRHKTPKASFTLHIAQRWAQSAFSGCLCIFYTVGVLFFFITYFIMNFYCLVSLFPERHMSGPYCSLAAGLVLLVWHGCLWCVAVIFYYVSSEEKGNLERRFRRTRLSLKWWFIVMRFDLSSFYLLFFICPTEGHLISTWNVTGSEGVWGITITAGVSVNWP